LGLKGNARMFGGDAQGSGAHRNPFSELRPSVSEPQRGSRMRLRCVGLVAVLCISAIAVLPIVRDVRAAPDYAILEIPPLPGDDTVWPWAINNVGQIVGSSQRNGEHGGPIVYSDMTGTVPLPTLPGKPYGTAYDINDLGTIVGTVWDKPVPPRNVTAVRWDTSGITDLGAPGVSSSAFGVNASGAVVGAYAMDSAPYDTHAFLHTDTTGMLDLTPSLPANTTAEARAINDAGQVAGTRAGMAFRWESGVFTDLGVLYNYDQSWAAAINPSGQVACMSWTVPQQYAKLCRYTDGRGLQDLGGVDDFNIAHGINAFGDVVGTGRVVPDTFPRALLREDGGGLYDLNDHVGPSSGFDLHMAYDINDARRIIVMAIRNDPPGWAGLLLIPTGPDPEPIPPILEAVRLEGSNREDVRLSWRLSPDDGAGANDVTRYEIRAGSTYSASGSGYSLIATVPRGLGTFVHADGGANSPATWFYRVIARDATGHATPAGVQGAKLSLSLDVGWNLVSSPLEQADWRVERAFDGLPWTRARTFQNPAPTGSEWLVFDRTKGSGNLGTLNRNMAVWLQLETSARWSLAGLVHSSTSIPLAPGWNLIGYPSVIPNTIDEILAGLPWTAAEGYAAVPPYFLQTMAGSDSVAPGAGLWVHMAAAGVLVVTN